MNGARVPVDVAAGRLSRPVKTRMTPPNVTIARRAGDWRASLSTSSRPAQAVALSFCPTSTRSPSLLRAAAGGPHWSTMPPVGVRCRQGGAGTSCGMSAAEASGAGASVPGQAWAAATRECDARYGDGMSATVHVAWSPQLLGYDFGLGHPMSPVRLRLTVELARELGLLEGAEALVV